MILQKIERRRDLIRSYIYTNVVPITSIEMRQTRENETIEAAMAAKDYKKVAIGQRWGLDYFTSAWFRLRFTVPAEHRGRQVHLRMQPQGEACCFLNRVPLQGLDINRDDIKLLDKAKGGETYELYVEAGVTDAFGGYPGPNERRLLKAELVTFNPEVSDYYWDLAVLINLAQRLPENSTRRQRIIYEVNRSVDAFDYHNTDDDTLRESAIRARRIAAPLLKLPASESMPEISMSGHAHIDVAWLWPLKETIRKCSRTFSNVVKYMEEYPYFTFTQSQAQLYEYTQQHYPALYKKIKHWAKARRWEVMTGMWVEADCNVTGGESLVRQCIHGKNFARDEFGVDVNVLWLPDVFGYSAALPQILKKSGIDYFSTIKIHWNESNKFPYTSFVWEGIDGTGILSHFPPTGGYNEDIRPDRLVAEIEGMQERDRSNHAFFAFGHGDGGGGPTKSMIENAKRMKSLEGLPRTKMEFLGDFFRQLETEQDKLPKWVGELYLETHRKTYTTQSNNKKNNRQSELLFRDAELLAVLAATQGKRYPKREFDKTWKRILCNQFHDILPGSSIPAVYRDSDKEYETILATGNAIRSDSFTALAKRIDTTGEGAPVVVFNSLSWDRSGIVQIPHPASRSAHVADAEGKVMPSEKIGASLHFLAEDVPAMGHKTFFVQEGKAPALPPEVSATENRLESPFWRIDFDAAGLIRRIWDKQAKRDVLPRGERANVFQVFEDKPNCFDAWNLDAYYEAKRVDLTTADSVEAGHSGPMSASVKIRRSFSKTTIEQEIVVYADNPRIDFRTRIDWHERHRIMKAAFPVDVHSSRATYEIQYGHTERPTHRNTSWDSARFEVCAQKWMDLSEPGYGVSLLNNSKYGHDTHGNVIRLTLVCGPLEPDALADEGLHEFVYSLLPHAGDFREAGTIRAAYDLNIPLLALPVARSKGGIPAEHSWFSVDAPNVIIEAVKQEERGERVIVRVYECEGRRGRASLTTSLPFRRVAECDLMEKDIEKLTAKNGTITFDARPFDIRTFAFTLK